MTTSRITKENDPITVGAASSSQSSGRFLSRLLLGLRSARTRCVQASLGIQKAQAMTSPTRCITYEAFGTHESCFTTNSPWSSTFLISSTLQTFAKLWFIGWFVHMPAGKPPVACGRHSCPLCCAESFTALARCRAGRSSSVECERTFRRFIQMQQCSGRFENRGM